MKHHEAKKLAALIAKSFPNQVTEGHRDLMVKNFRGLSTSSVESAINAHHTSRATVDWPAFWAACEAAAGAENAPSPVASGVGNRARAAAETFADVVRRQDPQLADVASDFEVLLRYWRKCWTRYTAGRGGACTELQRRQAMGERERVTNNCRNDLVSHGMDRAVADAAVAAVFDPDDAFRAVLNGLRAQPSLPVLA